MKKRMRKRLFELFILFMAAGLAVLPVGNAAAYHHENSLTRWREYSAEAFEEAKRTGRPIFMVISAIWCYNCHIYWEKSLETREIAAYLNENYIPVFVDYDRRKDVARSYPAGGIPITVIIAPTGDELISVPGYIEKEMLLGNLKRTVAYVKTEFKPEAAKTKKANRGPGVTLPTAESLKAYLNGFEKTVNAAYDPAFGGFGQAEKQVYAEKWLRVLELSDSGRKKDWLDKFRNTAEQMAGLRQKDIRRKRPSFKELVALRERDRTALEEVDRLQDDDKMVGVYDSVEGGFFRYATKRDWSAPHFEKMLMENAGMTELFLEGYLITKDRRYGEIASRSLDYILKTLYDEADGRFMGSQDADEVYYHFTVDERKKASPPKVDGTSYTASSARAAITLFHASDVLKDEKYKKAGLKGLAFIEKTLMTSNEGVLSYYDSEKKKGFINGQLEDNAWVSLAFLEAYEATKEKKYLDKAEGIIKFAIEKLYDKENGGFFERRSTSREFYRDAELFLDSKPDDLNGVMAYALLKDAKMTGTKEYQKKADETVGSFAAMFAAGELNTVEPYMHRAAQMILESGRYK